MRLYFIIYTLYKCCTSFQGCLNWACVLLQRVRVFVHVPSEQTKKRLKKANIDVTQLPLSAWAPAVGDVNDVGMDLAEFSNLSPALAAASISNAIRTALGVPGSANKFTHLSTKQKVMPTKNVTSETTIAMGGSKASRRMHARNRLIYIYLVTHKFYSQVLHGRWQKC